MTEFIPKSYSSFLDTNTKNVLKVVKYVEMPKAKVHKVSNKTQH